MVGINETKGYVEHSEGALVIVITNGFSDLVFKSRCSHDDNPNRIDGPNRLQSQLFALTLTWMARLEKIPKFRKVDMRKDTLSITAFARLG